MFDLDDTLFPQADFLAGAWAAVVAAAGAAGVPAAGCARLHAVLVAIAAEGSDRGGIIDRALAECRLPGDLVAPLVAAFRCHVPSRLEPYPGAADALAGLRGSVRVGCLTDGDPRIQQGKLAALGLTDAFDAVVISDQLGRQHRKPDPLPFVTLLNALGVDPARAVHIGDRHAKDVIGAHRVGMRAIRVRTGEYAAVEVEAGSAPADADCSDVVAAVRLVSRWLDDRVRQNARPARGFLHTITSR